MKKLKCESCGGKLVPDKSGEYAVCEYCGTKFKLKEDINVNFNYKDDDSNNHPFDDEFNNVNSASNINKTIPVIIFVIVTIVMIVMVVRFIMMGKPNHSKISYTTSIENEISEVDISSFNGGIELYNGTQSAFFVQNLLDKINLSNQKNPDKIIIVEYNETTTTDGDEIRAMKKSLSKSEYEVILEYDEVGFIKKVKIQDL